VRQAILIALLIGAAFLGGAFVNGPGLQWAQSRAIRLLGLNNGGEIAAVDLKSTSNGEIGPEPAEPPKQRAAITPGSIAPTPSVVSQGKPPKQNASDKRSASLLRPMPSESSVDSDQSRQSSLPSATVPPSVTKSSSDAAAPLDQQVILARGDSLPRSSPPSRSAPTSTTQRAPAILESLGALFPPGDSSTDAPASPSIRPSTGSKTTPVVGDEWAILESKMQTLGVSRFTVEGQPGGPVVFACLIPVAGRQAVTERFEAEGDDIIHAAQAVLRRIVLWRATQLPRNDQKVPTEKSGN
jgi:hypothetical protein